MRKLAFLASAVRSVAALTAGCGGGTQTTQPLAPRSVSLSIRDNPPAGVSVLSFEINVTGATLQPYDASKAAVPLVTSSIEVELTQLETEKALLNALHAPQDSYGSISLTFANPELTILNQTGQPITIGTQACLNGQVCEFKPSLNQSSVTISSNPFPFTVSASAPIGLVIDFDLNSSIQNNLSVTPTVTLAAVPAQPSNGEIEDLNGRVQSVSSSGFTLQDNTSGQTFPINVDNNTQFQDFNEIGCPANNFSCVQVGQIVEVEHLLVMENGTLLASEIQLDDAVNGRTTGRHHCSGQCREQSVPDGRRGRRTRCAGRERRQFGDDLPQHARAICRRLRRFERCHSVRRFLRFGQRFARRTASKGPGADCFVTDHGHNRNYGSCETALVAVQGDSRVGQRAQLWGQQPADVVRQQWRQPSAGRGFVGDRV
jgi:hypothetical protein